jgi:RNA polymerase sigma-70 factor (ECF subfamily)
VDPVADPTDDSPPPAPASSSTSPSPAATVTSASTATATSAATATASTGTSTGAGRAARARALVDAARQNARGLDERRQLERARDEALVARARDGDTGAFQKLVVAHQGRLFSVAFGILRDRDEAMDVVQDAFIKAHRKLVDFEGNAAFSTWLYRIAVNLCIDRKRAAARRRTSDIDDVVGRDFESDPLYAEADYAPKLSGANPLRNIGDRQLGEHIGRGLATLSDDHRAIILLREVEGMSYDEIAAAMSIPRGTVMSRLFHARKNLQRALRPLLGLADDAGLDGRPVGDGEAVDEGGAARAPRAGAAPRGARPASGSLEDSPPGERPDPEARPSAPPPSAPSSSAPSSSAPSSSAPSSSAPSSSSSSSASSSARAANAPSPQRPS